MILLAFGCDGTTEPADAGPPDSGPEVPATCADTSVAYAFPSPHWIAPGAAGLIVPTEDVAAEALRALGWEDELVEAGAWPRRPTWIVPLDRDGGDVDATKARVAISDGADFAPLDVPVRVELVSPRTLAVTPRDPLPPEAIEVVLGLAPGVAGDARALAVCESGSPHPDQVAAAAELTGDIDVAIRLSLSRSTRPLVLLRERLAAAPVVTVTSARAVTLAELGEDAPTAEDAPHFSFPILRGELELPEYRRDGAAMELDADGAPLAQTVTTPAFVVALPAVGTAPYPVVLYQHGGGQSPIDVLDFGASLAEAGFAFVAIDLPEHGSRAGTMGGGDLDFLDFGSMLHTRENFRQATADHLAILEGLDAIEAAVESELGVVDALDGARRFYMGMSLGALTGSLTTACSRGLIASALFVGGAGWPELMTHGPFELAATRILRGAEPRPSTMLALVEVIGDAADPLAYAIAAEDPSAPRTPILFLQATDDPLISHAASDQWARAFGASLARPFDHEAEGMALVDLPARDNFEGVTRMLVQNPMSEIPPAGRHGGLILTDYSQAMVTRCFVSARDEGSCEVIDTDFASR